MGHGLSAVRSSAMDVRQCWKGRYGVKKSDVACICKQLVVLWAVASAGDDGGDRGLLETRLGHTQCYVLSWEPL